MTISLFSPVFARRVVFAFLFSLFARSASSSEWRAGVATVDITPEAGLWMSGYAGRDRPAGGTLAPLSAKALALSARDGETVVLVTLDLIGIQRDFGLRVRETLAGRFGLSDAQVAVATSHTHTGPVVGANLSVMYDLDPAQWDRLRAYESQLEAKISRVVGEAMDRRQPASLSWGVGNAQFAVNRRENPESAVPILRREGRLKGPVDHDVPTLIVRETDPESRAVGDLMAVVFGYACHATTLSGYEWSGDYPGFAQARVEAERPGVVALFWAGCGADVNPIPRRSVELAREYGRRLANAVLETVDGAPMAIEGKLEVAYKETPLAFRRLPTRAELEAQRESDDRYVSRRAESLIAQLEMSASNQMDKEYPYPVQYWKLGDQIDWLFLGGEVVVDYALLFKERFGGSRVWVTSYANDVMAYIPSLRVLEEGGYEGAGAMVYYGQPDQWAEDVEERVVEAVDAMVGVTSKE